MVRISIIVLAAILCMTVSSPIDPEPNLVDWWIDHHNRNIQNTLINGQNINILFYGDSLTEFWAEAGSLTYNTFYEPLGTANYGIGGDQTQQLLYRISNGEVEGLAPKICVLMIGTNNLSYDYEDRDIANGVITVVNLLRLKLPNMKILLLGILPRSNIEFIVRSDNINTMIDDLDNGNNIRFFNMRDTFYVNGNFNLSLYNEDLVHLSADGYSAWQMVMDPIFQEMLL